MTTSRDKILTKLRAAKKPFPDAPPRPQKYLPVVQIKDTSPEGLLARFKTELENIKGQVFAVDGDEGARACVLDLLQSHKANHIITWDFEHIPVAGLEGAIWDSGIQITQPQMHDEFRSETIESIRDAQVGLTGVDVAVAGTGTMVVSTGPGKGRLPTVLAPVHIAVISLDQIVPRLEDWLARERANGSVRMRDSANIAFITGPSRTADLEMVLILGVHGPGKVQVVVKK